MNCFAQYVSPCRCWRIWAIGLTLLCLSNVSSAVEPAHLLSGFDRTRIILIAENAPCVLFSVYVAASPEQRSQGLMHIKKMDEFEGMIFVYRQSVDIAMWMKNTLISLDMIFIRANRTISGVAANTVPLSTKTIYSGEPVSMVLELNAGQAARWGITSGGRIIFSDRDVKTTRSRTAARHTSTDQV
jgi:uncharacterized membrane protein (UPF0127 family)